MIGSTSKPWDVYDSRKKDVPTNEGETEIPFFVIICGWIDFFIWIKAKVEHRNCFLIPRIPKDAYTIPIQSLELQTKPIKPPYNDLIVIIFQIKNELYFFVLYYLFVFLLWSLLQPYFGQVWGWSPTLGKVESWSPPGLPNV
jgi:hypothetical protein